jgi:hypothetical protein
MTLLNFGLYCNNEPQQALRNALRDISDNYIEHSWRDNPGLARVHFHALMAKHKPDVVFMQIQTPDIIKASTLARYPNVKFFNFSGDVRPVFPQWYFEVAPYCTTLFTNTDWVEMMVTKGFRATYFQVGFGHDIYKPEGPKEITKPVVFMGNNHGNNFPLSKLRGDMIERFKDKEWFQCYGRGWGPDVIDTYYQQQRQAAIYRGAKIGINLSHMDLASYTSDRMFRIMGCGCMCLAYRHKDIEKEFSEDENVIMWSTLDELEKKIEYFLQFPARAFNIGSYGYYLVHKYYTWPARLKKDLIPIL